jgi:hypothetical protein
MLAVPSSLAGNARAAFSEYRSIDQEQKPARGVEPPTDGLRNHCSTTELRWQYNQGLYHGPNRLQLEGEWTD